MVRPVAGPFDSAWFKWGWAVVHAQALDADVAAYSQDADIHLPYTTRTEYDAKRHCVVLRVATIEPLPMRWGLRIGDIANNFRAALDHLAWAIVHQGSQAGKLTRKQERNVYFPIASSRADFKSGLGMLPGIRAADRAVIRRYQPYMRGKTNLWRHCLTPLPRLTADDKHKQIRPVWSVPLTGRVRQGPPRDCEVTRVPMQARRVILQEGAEIQRVYVRKTGSNPDVEMEAHITAQPTLDGRIHLGEWVQQTTFHIRDLIWEFSDPPEELGTLGILTSKQKGPPPPKR